MSVPPSPLQILIMLLPGLVLLLMGSVALMEGWREDNFKARMTGATLFFLGLSWELVLLTWLFFKALHA